jgi:DnaJ-class molecular chaperone
MRSRRFTMSFEVERGSGTVEYECEFVASPGSPGKTYGPPEDCYPAEPPEVESKSVYFTFKKACPGCKGTGIVTAEPRIVCTKCRGTKRITVREERPELEDLVDDAELIEYAGGSDDGADDDRAYDEMRDRLAERGM